MKFVTPASIGGVSDAEIHFLRMARGPYLRKHSTMLELVIRIHHP
jgi:hypothetical protein